MSRAALLGTFVLVTAGLSGCATPAKIIHQDQNSVVIAIPDNTNSWPFYYQEEAAKTAASALHDPILKSSTRVKIGEQTTNRQDTTRHDIGGRGDKPPTGDLITSTSTTSTSDSYEWHLVFERRTTNEIPNSIRSRIPAPPTPSGPPIMPAGGLPSESPTVTPANDIQMPAAPPPTSLPPTSLPPTPLQTPQL